MISLSGFGQCRRVFGRSFCSEGRLAARKVRPLKESSYGVIPLEKDAAGSWKVLLVQQVAGHWGFPKGRAERDERPHETARRELYEETGLEVAEYLSPKWLQMEYRFFKGERETRKTASFALALVKGHLSLQRKEVQDCRWVSLEQAEALLTYRESKELIKGCVAELRLKKTDTHEE